MIGLELNALKVNTSKTQLIVFGSHQQLRELASISRYHSVTQRCSHARRWCNLGVTFDSTLSWDAHVSELCRRCTGLLIGLSHARHCLPDGIISMR